jgi:CubicO group peptidase (beta-lactamase class C family)
MTFALPRRTALPVLLALCAVFPGPAAGFTCPALDGDAKRAMDAWQVPGMALGVVEDGQIVLRRTYGFRNVENGLPVTPRTVFGTGSLTKSFTALGIAIAAAEGRLSIDRPVRQLLDYFPGDITLRHLLSHTAGWPRHDALWYLDSYDRRELPRRLALLPRFAKAGEAFQYNNVPFAVAGVALSAATGETWDDWIAGKILNKTGMTHTVTTLAGFRNAPNRASPYFPAAAGRISLPLRDTDPVGPAAGLYAPIDDMLKYTQALAGHGNIDGKQVLPEAAVKLLTAPQPGTYGLGLRLLSWQGQRLAFHPGFIDGYGARLSLLPDSRSGVLVLTNMSGETPVARILSQHALDCLTGASRTDWIARFGGGRKSPAAEPAPPGPVPPDRTLEAYSGSFDHPAYGRLTFSTETGSDRLIGRFHGRRLELDYDGEDRWRLTETHWPLREGLVFAFQGLNRGRFSEVTSPLADGPTYRHNAGPLTFRQHILFKLPDRPD